MWSEEKFCSVSLVLSHCGAEGRQINWLTNEHRYGQIIIEIKGGGAAVEFSTVQWRAGIEL